MMKKTVSEAHLVFLLSHLCRLILDPTVKFEDGNYTIQAPNYQNECSVLNVAVVRDNDIDYANSVVHYSTTDDTAVAGNDYYESNGTFHFSVGEKKKIISILICTHHIPTNQTKRFHVHIMKGDNSTRVATPSVIEVVILGRNPITPFFHREPVVMLSENIPHYGTAGQKSLVCITVSQCSMHNQCIYCL